MPGLHDNIVEAAKKLDAADTIPFVSLTDRIQTEHHCMVSFRQSSAFPLRAFCSTKIAHFRYHDKQEEPGFYLPHHIIIVHPGELHDTVRRFAVGHEIGHIALHFGQYLDYFKDDSNSNVFGKNGEIKHTYQEEIEASIFAGVLCRRRSPTGRRRTVPVDDLVREINDVIAQDEDLLAKGMNDRVIEGVRQACEMLEEEEQDANRAKDRKPLNQLSDVVGMLEQHCSSCDIGNAVSNASRYLSAAILHAQAQDDSRSKEEISRANIALTKSATLPKNYAVNRIKLIAEAIQSLT